MRDLFKGAALALMAVSGGGAAAAQPAATEADPQWVSFVSITRLSDEFLERPETTNLSRVHPEPWTILNQRVSLPATLGTQALSHDTFVVLEVGRRGEATGCSLLRSTTEPRLDAMSCQYLMRPGLFSASIVPREMEPSRWVMTLHWMTESAADFERRLRGVILPTIRPAMPLHFPVRQPPSQEERRWISGRVRTSDFADIADRRLRRPQFTALLSVNIIGRPTECRVLAGTGNRAVDFRTCQAILRRSRFSERADAEGRLIADRLRVYVNVGALFRPSRTAE